MQDGKDNPGWQYQPETGPYDSSEFENGPSMPKEVQPIEWTASEFIEHHKNTGWYLLMVAGAIVVTGLIYWLTKDGLSSFTVFLAAIAFVVIGAKKPQTLKYRIDSQGISVGQKTYSYDDFKSFSIMYEGPANSIYLMPLKRFMPSVSLYYSPKNEDHIVEALQYYLPQEQRTSDPLDRLMHKIRF